MTEEEDKQEEKFDFTSEGEALGYISLEQARLLAMQTARDNPGNYGPRFSHVPMVFDLVEQEDGEDYYTITLSLRPEGNFAGVAGQEQFFIEKKGRSPTGRCAASRERRRGGYRSSRPLSG